MTKLEQAKNNDVDAYIKRAITIETELESLAEEKKDLYTEIKATGIHMKAFRAAVKEIRKPVDKLFRNRVNEYLSKAGQYLLFTDD